MAQELIIPAPLYGGLTGKNIINKFETNFSDGYSQSTLIGINAVKRQYTVKWVLPTESFLNTLSILQEHEKGIAFLYTFKGDKQRKYKVSEVSFTDNQPIYGSITATFTESFEI